MVCIFSLLVIFILSN